MFMGGFAIVVLVIVLVAIVIGFPRRDDDAAAPAGRILDERFAAGEIDEREYEQRRAQLQGSDTASARRSRWALIGTALAVVVLVGALLAFGSGMGAGWMGGAGHMGRSDGSTATSDEAVVGAAEVTVRAGELWFEPRLIDASGGEPLNITVTNTGSVFHDLTIDELDLRIAVEPGDTATAGLGAPEPGEYEFYCTVPGHARGGMTGTLAVAPSP